MREIPERDWKWLRQVKDAALNRFCEKIFEGAVEITALPKATPHERYLRLYKFIHEEDRKIADAFNDHCRSTAWHKIMYLYSQQMLTEEEFAGFSEETRNLVLLLTTPGHNQQNR